MTRNPYPLRRELTAIVVLLALATPTGSHALVDLSAWAGQQFAHAVLHPVPTPATPTEDTINPAGQEAHR